MSKQVIRHTVLASIGQQFLNGLRQQHSKICRHETCHIILVRNTHDLYWQNVRAIHLTRYRAIARPCRASLFLIIIFSEIPDLAALYKYKIFLDIKYTPSIYNCAMMILRMLNLQKIVYSSRKISTNFSRGTAHLTCTSNVKSAGHKN